MTGTEQSTAEYPVSWSDCTVCEKRIYTRPKFNGRWLHLAVVTDHAPIPGEYVDVV